MATRTNSTGNCNSCGKTFSRGAIGKHLAKCAYPEGPDVAAVAQIRVDAPGSPYWLDLDVKTSATMAQLDQFLRSIWLDCCGHLSSFQIGRTRYEVSMQDSEPGERSMRARVSAALPPAGSVFTYEYDYGSTTSLRLKVVAQHDAPSRREAVRLLARNEPPVWTCEECDATAGSLCAECSLGGDAFFCEEHAEEHDCGEDAMLPVVNSPRMGVCAYTG